MQINVRSNVDDVLRGIREVREDQIPFATARALTQTASSLKAQLEATMPRVFDRPTPFTLNSVYFKPATKASLTAQVGLKDFIPKGTPASVYLQAQIHGGSRTQKKMESALVQNAGVLGSREFWVPGQKAAIDPYGNQLRGEITQALSALRSFSEQGYSANRTRQSQDRRGSGLRQIFVSRGDRHLPRGIFERVNVGGARRVQPLAIFAKAANYKQRFDFYGISRSFVASKFTNTFAESFAQAMATAKPLPT